MAKTSLNFNKEGSEYKATFVSSGNTLVQLKRTATEQGVVGYIRVYANIEGMDPIILASWNKFSSELDLIFQVDLMPGIVVTILSNSEIKSANILTE